MDATAEGVKGKLNKTNLRLNLIILKQGLSKYLLSKRWWLARAADTHFGAVKRLSWYYKQLWRRLPEYAKRIHGHHKERTLLPDTRRIHWRVCSMLTPSGVGCPRIVIDFMQVWRHENCD